MSEILKYIRIGNLDGDYKNKVNILKVSRNKVIGSIYDEYHTRDSIVTKKYDIDDIAYESYIIDEILTTIKSRWKRDYIILQNPFDSNYKAPLFIGNNSYRINIQQNSKNIFQSTYIKISWIKKSDEYSITKSYKFINRENPKKIKIFDYDLNDYEVEESQKEDYIKKASIFQIKNLSEEWIAKHIYYTGVDSNFSLEYNESYAFNSNINDTRILEQVIQAWKNNVGGDYPIMFYPINSGSDEDISLENKLLESEVELYLDPLIGSNSKSSPTQSTPTNEVIDNKIKLNLEYIKDGYVLKQKEDFSFNVYIGDIPKPTNLNGEELSDEYTEGEVSIEDEKFSEIDEVETIDKLIGNSDGEILSFPENSSFSEKQKISITNSINNFTENGSFGKCSRYTFNIANNYVRQLKGKSINNKIVASGGNANTNGYWANLEVLGYKKYNGGTLSTEELKRELSNTKWGIGDIVVYWGMNGSNSLSCVKYGHTQIYTGGLVNNGVWACDKKNNWLCSFVYNNYSDKVTSWKYIRFKYNEQLS